MTEKSVEHRGFATVGERIRPAILGCSAFITGSAFTAHFISSVCDNVRLSGLEATRVLSSAALVGLGAKSLYETGMLSDKICDSTQGVSALTLFTSGGLLGHMVFEMFETLQLTSAVRSVWLHHIVFSGCVAASIVFGRFQAHAATGGISENIVISTVLSRWARRANAYVLPSRLLVGSCMAARLSADFMWLRSFLRFRSLKRPLNNDEKKELFYRAFGMSSFALVFALDVMWTYEFLQSTHRAIINWY